MMTVKNKNRIHLVDAAMQRIPCDISIENTQLLNVITGEIYTASIDIIDGIIVRVRGEGEVTKVPSNTIYEGKGKYLLPGFIDTHMHVESTFMVPEIFGEIAIKWGTTTVVTDPHEIANVMGIDGVQFMLDSALRAPLRQYILAPSCVPSIPKLESTGAAFGAREISKMLEMDGVIGIAEIMDYVGVYNNDKRMSEIISEGLKRDIFLQGHAPSLTNKELAAYIVGGPVSDHECQYRNEILEKMRSGMHINIKAHNTTDCIKELLPGILSGLWSDTVSICTDDVDAAELLDKGHVNFVVRRCIEEGFEPIQAIRFATFNAAKEYGFSDIGAIAPGYVADIQLVDTLDFKKKPNMVFINGNLVSTNDEKVINNKKEAWNLDINTVNIPDLKNENVFRLKAPSNCNSKANIASISVGSKQTARYETLSVKDGFVEIDDLTQLQYICVLNRYGSGGKTIALLRDFGLTHGAIASTVSHDSHNMTVIYTNWIFR
jgi:adenine deaminase